jgi:hypothetical protein
MGIGKGVEIQTNGVDNLFNNIIAENFLNLQEREEHPGSGGLWNTKLLGSEKKQHQIYHNQKHSIYRTRRNSESCKREKTSHR